MTREEIFNFINKDRNERFKDLSKAIGSNVIERFVNNSLNTKNLDENFAKNIKCACEVLMHVNDSTKLQDQGDVLYLAIIHLIDSFCLLEEKRMLMDSSALYKVINNLMRGFKQ